MTNSPLRRAALLGFMLALGACAKDTTRDTFVDSGPLERLPATVWVDPDGCKHWVIDDGVEGYMSPVLDMDGKPECV